MEDSAAAMAELKIVFMSIMELVWFMDEEGPLEEKIYKRCFKMYQRDGISGASNI